ncbi:hypothetical protein JCM10212_004503 [Sporobolomyces blumeae]
MADSLPDPLLLLRSALSSGRTIALLSANETEVFSLSQATAISFPASSTTTASRPASFPKQTPTRFYSVPNPTSDSPTYDLATLLFGFQNRDAPTAEYLRLARQDGVGFISVTDRKLVIEYLSGKGDEQGPKGRIRELDDRDRSSTKRQLDAGQGNADGPTTQTDTAADGTVSNSAGTVATGVASETTSTTTATASAGAADAAHAPPPQKRARYVPNKEDQEKVKRMMSIIDGPAYGHVVGPNETKFEKSGAAFHSRETVLRGERSNNFDSVRSLIGPRLAALRELTRASSSSSSKANASQGANANGSTAGPGGLKPQQSKKKQLNPIIMISPSSTALITMHNVKDLLEDSRFVPDPPVALLPAFIPSDEARSRAAGASSAYIAEDVIQVNHQRASGQPQHHSTGGSQTVETRKARYFVVDSVEALAKFGGAGRVDEAWDRVVCVMTTGQEWQFKPYKWKEPKELFHHVKGIYPQWTTDPPNPKIKAWNVSELKIDPHKRHIDKSVVADFWRNLEAWIATHKSWLSY